MPGKNRIGCGASVSVSPPTAAAFLPTSRRSPAAIDSMFYFCSYRLMFRVDDETLAVHLEVALATAPPSLLDRLGDSDGHRRNVAVGKIARQLVDRLRCFDILSEDAAFSHNEHPTLFPQDLGPIG